MYVFLKYELQRNGLVQYKKDFDYFYVEGFQVARNL